MKENKLKILVEVAIFAAIAVALDFIQSAFFKGIWANGGSLGIAMLPIFVISYRRGLVSGLLCGLIVSIVQMLGGIYSVQGATFDNEFMKVAGPFIQIMLDYILAYTVVGFAGAFSRLYANGKSLKVKIIWVFVGSFVGGMLKFLCHYFAGYFWLNMYNNPFWGINDTTMMFSLVYNGSYGIPNAIICSVIMVIFARFYPNLLNPKKEYVNELDEDNKEEDTANEQK